VGNWNCYITNNKAIKITIFDLFDASMKARQRYALAHKLLYNADFETDSLSISMYMAKGSVRFVKRGFVDFHALDQSEGLFY
jgi:hypothetical protein